MHYVSMAGAPLQDCLSIVDLRFQNAYVLSLFFHLHLSVQQRL